jgi:hypothetical protein
LKPKKPKSKRLLAKDKEAYEAMSNLELEQLQNLVKEKQLPIDIDDYDNADDLLVAICQELDLVIPEQD